MGALLCLVNWSRTAHPFAQCTSTNDIHKFMTLIQNSNRSICLWTRKQLEYMFLISHFRKYDALSRSYVLFWSRASLLCQNSIMWSGMAHDAGSLCFSWHAYGSLQSFFITTCSRRAAGIYGAKWNTWATHASGCNNRSWTGHIQYSDCWNDIGHLLQWPIND